MAGSNRYEEDGSWTGGAKGGGDHGYCYGNDSDDIVADEEDRGDRHVDIWWDNDGREALVTRRYTSNNMGLSAEHPHTINSMEALVCIQYLRGRYDQCARLESSALGLRKKALGSQHSDTAKAKKSSRQPLHHRMQT